MSEERKKVKAKPIPVIVPKKREIVEGKPKEVVEVKKEAPKPVEVKKEIKKEEPKPVEVKKEVKEVEKKVKPQTQYLRIAIDAPNEERKELNARVLKGELRVAYYAIDGNKGYHYYQIF